MKLWKSVLVCTAAVTMFAARGSLVQQAPASAARLQNPFKQDEVARRAGAKLYERECAACHGEQREGIGKAPPLARRDIYQTFPGALFWVLRNGSLRRGMPSFAQLPERERWQIITFLREARQSAIPLKTSGHAPVTDR